MVANLKHFIRKFIAKLVIEFATNLQVCKFIANLFFRPVEALESFMNLSMVACINADTNMRLDGAFTTNKASTMDELLEFVITRAAAKGKMRDNVLSLGYRRSQIRPAVMGSRTSGYENNMVAHVQSPVFEVRKP